MNIIKSIFFFFYFLLNSTALVLGASLTGKFEIVVEDHLDYSKTKSIKAVVRYYLIQPDQSRVEMIPTPHQKLPQVSGVEMTITDVELVNSQSSNRLLQYEFKDFTVVNNQMKKVKSLGPYHHKVKVIAINLTDGNAFWNSSEIQQFAVQRTIDAYQFITHGNVIFNFDANADGVTDQNDISVVSIPYAGAGKCDYWTWITAAAQIVTNSGINLSQYNNLVYLLPANNTCPWQGLGSGGDVAGSFQTYLVARKAGGPDPFIIQHELGHNLGLGHSGIHDHENQFPFSGNLAYLDMSDFMGYEASLTNAPHTEELNVFETSAQGILDLTTHFQNSNQITVELSPLHSPLSSPHPQIVKIKDPRPNIYNQERWYYISVRKQIPNTLDSDLAWDYTQGFNIHRFEPSIVLGSSFFMGSTTASRPQFFDPYSGLTVTANSFGPNYSVTIRFECIRNPPKARWKNFDYQLSNQPAPAKIISWRQSALWELEVTNEDSPKCANAQLEALPDYQTFYHLPQNPGTCWPNYNRCINSAPVPSGPLPQTCGEFLMANLQTYFSVEPGRKVTYQFQASPDPSAIYPFSFPDDCSRPHDHDFDIKITNRTPNIPQHTLSVKGINVVDLSVALPPNNLAAVYVRQRKEVDITWRAPSTFDWMDVRKYQVYRRPLGASIAGTLISEIVISSENDFLNLPLRATDSNPYIGTAEYYVIVTNRAGNTTPIQNTPKVSVTVQMGEKEFIKEIIRVEGSF